MDLIIVESPTKARTITKFLGANYKVESSFGHIRDLPKSSTGVDVENNYIPTYEIPEKARPNLNKLKALAKNADRIILATDEDREGEAIAWHLAEALKIDPLTAGRIVFHEITKSAILHALEDPKTIDMNLVDAQQARRILDRLVGYELSPFLWKKVARGLSAGRVQSVAVRLIVEREREIQNFDSEEYWSFEADLSKPENKEIKILSKLNKINGKTADKFFVKNKEAADKVIAELKETEYTVANVEKKETKKTPPKPFTTSTLQQAANRNLGFSAKQTMMMAQRLYESGLITYMRTDSLNLSQKFMDDAKTFLSENLGANYCLKESRVHKKAKGAQEAHEAIRPTEASTLPSSKKESLETNQYRLYKLIWERAVASQMPEAKLDATTIDVDAKGTPYQFRATGQVLTFDGYLKIYNESSKELQLPALEKNETLNLEKLTPNQHETKPPARYSDAGLVKIMEKHGIGRPSTYAPTIATIEARNYMKRDEKKKLMPTEIAFVVIDLLTEHFNQIVDYKFTADMENKFDNIAGGKQKWQPVIDEFYKPFHKNLEIKYKEVNKDEVMPEEASEEKCDKCGAAMLVKTGKFGKFLACSAYPECKNIKSAGGPQDGPAEDDEKTKELQKKYKDQVCEKCKSPMAIKNGRFGPFLACTGYPNCKNIKTIEENSGSTGVKCHVCGKGEFVEKRSQRGKFYACDQYPECKTALWSKPTGEMCPDCKAPLLETDEGSKCSTKGCGYTKKSK